MDLRLSANNIGKDGSLKATVTITNTGNSDGVEIAQMYIRDCVSSAARPVKELKGFERVALKAGESKEVSFTITPDPLAFYDIHMQKTVEPGEFEVMVGGSSEDAQLLKTKFEVK